MENKYQRLFLAYTIVQFNIIYEALYKECLRQLDLYLPNLKVNSIVGDEYNKVILGEWDYKRTLVIKFLTSENTII